MRLVHQNKRGGMLTGQVNGRRYNTHAKSLNAFKYSKISDMSLFRVVLDAEQLCLPSLAGARSAANLYSGSKLRSLGKAALAVPVTF